MPVLNPLLPRRFRANRIARSIALWAVAGSGAVGGAAYADAVNWVPAADGEWNTASNWSSNPALPGAADNVTINVGGSVTVTHGFGINIVNSLTSNQALTVSSGTLTVFDGFSNSAATNVSGGTLTLQGLSSMSTLNLSNGTLNGVGTVTISGSTSWSGGTMTGPGITNANGGLDLTAFVYRALDGGRTLNVAGTSNWNSGALSLSGGSALNNTGTINNDTTAGGLNIQDFGGGYNSINNSGTFNKNGSGTTTVGVVFNNTSTGVVNVNAGTLELNGGGGVAGTGSIASGARLSFGGGTFDVNGTVLSGPGTVSVDGGAFVNTFGTVTTAGQLALTSGAFNANGAVNVASLNQTGGILGGFGTVTVSGSTSWSGGTMTDPGITNANGGLDLTAFGYRALEGGRTLNVAGTSNWNPGTLRLSGGSTLNNTGTINNDTTAGGLNIQDFGGGYNSVNNSGTFNKNGSGVTTVDVAFNNTSTGVVNVNAGTLGLNGGGTIAGTGSIASGARLSFGNGTFDVNGTVLSGPGTVSVDGGAVVNTSGTVVTGGQLALNNGTFNAGGAVNVASLNQTGGTLGGTGTVAVSGLTSWSAGTMTGPGTTNANGGLDLTAFGYRALEGGRTLNVAGTSNWSPGVLSLGGGSTVNNTGTINNDTTAGGLNIQDFGGGYNSINNSGSFNKNGSGQTFIGTAFNNTGTVNVNAGTLNLQNTSNLSAGTLTGGTWQVNAGGGTATLQLPGNVTTNNANVVLSGANSQVLNSSNTNALAGFNNNQGSFTIQDGRSFTAPAGTFTNSGTFASESGAAASFSGSVANSGTLRTDGGTITATAGISGNGAVVINGSSGGLSIGNVASTVGTLTHNGSTGSTLSLANTLTVSSDYNNANFGTGNAFNARANVSGGGAIVGANAAISITGAVTSTAANTYQMDLGYVRGGSTVTRDFQIANTGTGADIRGAIQTTGVTDSRLSGSAITVGGSNFGPVAAGSSTGSYSVTFDSSGGGGSLTGQSLAVVSNFSNVATQTINLTGGFTTLATGNATPSSSPVDLGNFRVGVAPAPTQSFSVQNTIPAGPGAEQLGIGSVATSGNFAANNVLGGGFLAAGVSQPGAVTAAVSGGVAGVNSGSLQIQYTSNGQNVDSSFGTINSNQQTINLQATGYNVATGAVAQTLVDFGNMRVGATAPSQALTVTNTAGTTFTESLNASFGTPSSAGIVASGSITGGFGSGLAGGASNTTALSIGLDTGTAGDKSGTVAVNFASNGVGTSGFTDTIASNSQTVSVTGAVYQAASGAIVSPTFDFGTLQVGQSVSQDLVIRNTATGPAGFVEDLHAQIAAVGGNSQITGSGSLNGITAGSDSTAANGTMTVTVTGATAGALSSSIGVNYYTAGAVGGVSNGLGQAFVGSESHGVNGTIAANVINQASPQVDTPTVTLANVRVGAASPTGLVSVTNVATAAPQAALNASFGPVSGPITASGSFSLLDPGATNAASLQVGLASTATAGAFTGTARIDFVSDAGNVGNCAPNCQMSIASQNVTVNGAVYRTANGPDNLVSAALSPTVLAARVGDASPTANIGVTNTSPDSYTERLKVGVGAAPAGFNASAAGGSIGAGDTGTAGTVSLNTSTAGTFSGSVGLSYISTGEGTTGAPDIGVGSGSVDVTGKVYTAATAGLSAGVIDFGILHVGDATSAQLRVTNSATASDLNDRLLGTLSVGGPFSGGGSLVGLGVGDSHDFLIGLNTGTAGAYSSLATFNGRSHNDDMADLVLGPMSTTLQVQINEYANAEFGLLSASSGTLFNHTGGIFVLDFGNLTLGSGARSASLEVRNNVAGDPLYIDLLRGIFDFGGGPNPFVLTGFTAFSGIEGGDAFGGLGIDFDPLALGNTIYDIRLDPFSYYLISGQAYEDSLASLTLRIMANVVDADATVPLPPSVLLVALGLAMLRVARQRAQRRTVH